MTNYTAPLELLDIKDRVHVLSKLSAWASERNDLSALERHSSQVPEELRPKFFDCVRIYLLEDIARYRTPALNAALANLKQASKSYEQVMAIDVGDGIDYGTRAYKAQSEAADALHKQIGDCIAAQLFVKLHRPGETNTIGTLGVLHSGDWTYYAEESNSQYTLQGICLSAVESISLEPMI